jgi:hypothetical protein
VTKPNLRKATTSWMLYEMGYGDEIMATGMAKGLHRKGKQAAFGDGRRIIWSEQAHQIFRGNPNVAPPGCERHRNLIWFAHYRHHRLYGDSKTGRWVWNEKFHATPGEIYLTQDETIWAERAGTDFILIEPNVKPTAPNKQWSFERYQTLADGLRADYPDLRIVQLLQAGGRPLQGVELLHSPGFRFALAVLARSALFVGPEGGLHHGAAALGKRAVVIFGGYISPVTTGYAMHINIYDPANGTACGIAGQHCPHCRRVMDSISVELVRRGVNSFLARGRKDVLSERVLPAGRGSPSGSTAAEGT